MNSKIALTIEIILLVAYLITIVFVLDTSKKIGLIELGVLTAIIFTVIIILEKKREAMMREAERISSLSNNQANLTNQQQGVSSQQNSSQNQQDNLSSTQQSSEPRPPSM